MSPGVSRTRRPLVVYVAHRHTTWVPGFRGLRHPGQVLLLLARGPDSKADLPEYETELNWRTGDVI